MKTTTPTPGRMLWRGVTRRCARCGTGHLFRRWFTMVDDCPGCGLHFEREEGYWVGAVVLNFAFVALIFVVAMTVFMAATLPDIPVPTLLMTLIPLMTFGPLFAYPFTKTTWVAIDLAFLHRL
jgi:uncharacterized protein (DUF983 family)